MDIVLFYDDPPLQASHRHGGQGVFSIFFSCRSATAGIFRGSGTNAMRWCLARLYYFIKTGKRSRTIRTIPHHNPFIGSSVSGYVAGHNHEDKNAVFHITRTIHVRVIVPDKI
jgi:hypothetical protein